MAGPKSKYSGFRRVSGAMAGKIAARVYVCKTCGLHHPPGNKPKACLDPSCGGLAFIKFDSKAEAARYATLCLLEGQGIISNLQTQVSFDLMAAKQLQGRTVQVKVARYVADFVYDRDGENITEDVKGSITSMAILKLKWMEAMGKPVKLTGGK